jgi:hypothetical protein
MLAACGSWWKGAIAYASGIAASALVFSAVNLLDLAFLKKPLGLLWIQSDAVLIGAVGPASILTAWLLSRRLSARKIAAAGLA